MGLRYGFSGQEIGEKRADSFVECDLSKDNRKPKEYFVASDANAIVEHTKRVLVIEDNEVVHMKVC
jgi:glucosamine--fructose-6-phosphate aminotransferase (isomerizing)